MKKTIGCILLLSIMGLSRSYAKPLITRQDSSSSLQKSRSVVRDIIGYLIREHIVKDRSEIESFILTDTAFVVNGEKLPEHRREWAKQLYIKEPGYVVYYGNKPMSGKGIFLRTDNL